MRTFKNRTQRLESARKLVLNSSDLVIFIYWLFDLRNLLILCLLPFLPLVHCVLYDNACYEKDNQDKESDSHYNFCTKRAIVI